MTAYVWPASHRAGTGTATDPPMGAWVRLKASVDISGYSPANQVILRAVTKHGMLLADGSYRVTTGTSPPSTTTSTFTIPSTTTTTRCAKKHGRCR